MADPRLKRRDDRRTAILDSALERWARGERIDLASLATEHGVGRTSAYRWFGDNDNLLAEVVAVRTRALFESLRREYSGLRGRERVLAIIEGVLRYAASSEHVQPLLQRDPQRMMAILASGAYSPQPLTISLIEGLLLEEQATNHLRLPVDAHTLAYGIARLMASFLYADIVANEAQDLDRAMDLIRLLLPA